MTEDDEQKMKNTQQFIVEQQAVLVTRLEQLTQYMDGLSSKYGHAC